MNVQYRHGSPVFLLRRCRTRGPGEANATPATELTAFLGSLSTAWKAGEVRPTHRKPARESRWSRTRTDPFAGAWPLVETWLIGEPTATAKDMLQRLAAMFPDVYVGKTHLHDCSR